MLTEQVVEMRMFHAHFCAFNYVTKKGRRISRDMGPLCRRSEPIKIFSRHENEVPPAMARDLNRFALGHPLKLAKVPLKFGGRYL
jgi:hypothetical protein